MLKKKENVKSFFDRFCIDIKRNYSDKLIWIHASSVGESISAVSLIQRLSQLPNNCNFLITTGTLSSYYLIKNKIPKGSFHQFAPIDSYFIVSKFIKNWKPKVGIFIESEFWPCLITEAAKNFNIISVNSRLSDKSYQRWKIYKFLFRIVSDNFKQIITQSDTDLKKYKKLGCKNVLNLGNIKFDNKKLPVNYNLFKTLSKIFKKKKIFVAASTHLEDEKIILQILKNLKQKKLDCYFIIVLRHPNRREDLEKRCVANSLKHEARTINTTPDENIDIYIVDSFGELGTFYKMADVVFIGGSFAHGGHNVLEPAHFSNVIIAGPDMSNFRDVTNDMISKKALLQVRDINELQENIEFFINDKNDKIVDSYKQNSLEFVKNNNEILEHYVDKIEKFLK